MIKTLKCNTILQLFRYFYYRYFLFYLMLSILTDNTNLVLEIIEKINATKHNN